MCIRDSNDVAHQDEVTRSLEKALETANMPHMLFYGPPGTGKTTCALAICRQLYGPDLIKSRMLELNASDERGISVVRTKIKGFASTAVGQGAPGYPSPPYKILILDDLASLLSIKLNRKNKKGDKDYYWGPFELPGNKQGHLGPKEQDEILEDAVGTRWERLLRKFDGRVEDVKRTLLLSRPV